MLNHTDDENMGKKKKVDIENTGLRQKPGADGIEYDFHMTSVLKKLFPKIKWEDWIQESAVYDLNGNSLKTPKKRDYTPDFRNDDLKLIIEIDGAGARYSSHYCDPYECFKNSRGTKLFEQLGYKVIRIPMYIQLDAEMIKFYFGNDYPEKLYQAADCHGFLHREIALPASFCEAGIERFKKEMDSIPSSVCNKIIETLKCRIKQYMNLGIDESQSIRLVIPSSLDYLMK